MKLTYDGKDMGAYYCQEYYVQRFGEVGEPTIWDKFQTEEEAIEYCKKISGASVIKRIEEEIFTNET